MLRILLDRYRFSGFYRDFGRTDGATYFSVGSTMLKMKKSSCFRLLLLSFTFILSIVWVHPQSLKNTDTRGQAHMEFFSKDENNLYDFILNNLALSNGGLRTNCLEIPPRGDLPAGSDILSESLGLMLEYSLEANSPSLFEQQFQLLERSFLNHDGTISWKISRDHKTRANTNALIDDLRICGALLSGYEKWGHDRYLKRALDISGSLKTHNVKHNVLVDYYDRDSTQSADCLSLRYIDVYAMMQLMKYDKDWSLICNTAAKILENGATDKRHIFYYEVYHPSLGAYRHPKSVNTINQLAILENSLKAGYKREKMLEWLKSSFQWHGFIVDQYDGATGKPISKSESPAIYSLCCRTFLLAGDHVMAEAFYKRLNLFIIKDADSRLSGGYAFLGSGECYSYDNLQALLTIRYRNNYKRQ
jgi:hypothetical protein